MKIDKNPQKIKALFDEIAKYYDFMNNVISLGTHNFIKTIAIKDLKIKNNSFLLDLASGTGDIVKIVSKYCPETKIIGLDISDEMLEIAKVKNPDVEFIKKDAVNIPFEDEKFDYVTISFGLRNIEERKKALSEIYRVLKKGGLFLHLDFGEHNLISEIFDLFVGFIPKLLNKNIKSYRYLIESKNDYPKPDKLIEEFENAGLKLTAKKYFMFNSISYQIMKK